MNLLSAKTQVSHFITNNAEDILTGTGIVGTVATAVLTGRASFKAQKEIHEAELHLAPFPHDDDEVKKDRTSSQRFAGLPDLDRGEVIKLVWPYFIPPVLVGSATIGSIFWANRMSAQKAAALVAAAGLANDRLDEYKAKVSEKLTGPKAKAIDDEIAQDQVDAKPTSQQVIIIAGGDALCFDTMSGRYFRSSIEQIKRAEAEVNQMMFDSQMASLSDFYEHIGLDRTGISDLLGWNSLEEGIIEFKITTTTSDDQQPCFAITPSRNPEPGFTKMIP